MIGNPIFRREIHAASRDPRVSILTLAFVLILAAILILLWPANGIFSLASEGSMQIFVIFLMAQPDADLPFCAGAVEFGGDQRAGESVV